MNKRPKTFSEIANELLLKSNPEEMLKESGKNNPSLDDFITAVRNVERQPLQRIS